MKRVVSTRDHVEQCPWYPMQSPDFDQGFSELSGWFNRSDFWPAAFSGLLGLTNGHLATIALIHAPKLVPSKLRYAADGAALERN